MSRTSPAEISDQFQSRLGSLLGQLFSNPNLLPTLGTPFLAGYITGWNLTLDSWRDYSRTEQLVLSLALTFGLTLMVTVSVVFAGVFVELLVGSEYITIIIVLGILSFIGTLRIIRSGTKERKELHQNLRRRTITWRYSEGDLHP